MIKKLPGPIHHIFVYGTLRSDFHHEAHLYIARFFTLAARGRVRGKLYDCVEYPAGIPDEGDFFIAGELYGITKVEEFDKAMQVLDEYEGSYDQAGEPALFRRELADVQVENDVVKAWIYWYNRPIAGKKWIASGDILKSDF